MGHRKEISRIRREDLLPPFLRPRVEPFTTPPPLPRRELVLARPRSRVVARVAAASGRVATRSRRRCGWCRPIRVWPPSGVVGRSSTSSASLSTWLAVTASIVRSFTGLRFSRASPAGGRRGGDVSPVNRPHLGFLGERVTRRALWDRRRRCCRWGGEGLAFNVSGRWPAVSYSAHPLYGIAGEVETATRHRPRAWPPRHPSVKVSAGPRMLAQIHCRRSRRLLAQGRSRVAGGSRRRR